MGVVHRAQREVLRGPLTTRFRFVVALVLVAFTVAGCQPQRDASTLRLTLTSEPATIDPSKATDVASFVVVSNLFEGLTRYDDALEVQPAVASSWSFDDDMTRITFHLRDDALWSDGRPVVAGDFVYAWRRLVDPATAAEYAYFIYDVAGAEAVNTGQAPVEALGVRAPDEHTLVVDLIRPAPWFPHVTTFMSTFPLRRDVIEAEPLAWTEPEHLVSNGPFRLAAWQHDAVLRLERSQTYHLAPVQLAAAELLVVRQANTAYSLYETGDVDVVLDLLPLAIPSVRGRDDYVNLATLEARYVGFHQAAPPLDDVRVRRALVQAVDRDEVARVLGGGERPLASFLPPGMFGHAPDIGLAFDPDAARAELAAAGYPGGDGFPELELLYRSGDDWRLQAENLQEQWRRQLGIPIRVVVHDQAAFFRRIADDPPPMHLARWIADFPDPENFMSLFTSGSGNNHLAFSDPDYDALVDRAATTREPEARRAAYDRTQRLLVEDHVAIAPVYAGATNAMVRDTVRGLSLNAMGVVYLRDVSVESRAQ